MSKRVFIPIIVVAFSIAIMTVLYFIYRGSNTYLDFSIRDKISGGWVWDSTIVLQNRTIRSFYQSDRGLREYRFKSLKPGNEILQISAPGYNTLSIPVALKRGANRLDEPVDLAGLEIPGLDYFLLFERLEGADIKVEIRPVGIDGTAVVNHPCMDLWIGARVTVQMTSEGIAVEPTDTGSLRGDELFRGRIEWGWDAAPETVFRYSAVIPGAEIKYPEAPYRIVDYLIVIPEPEGMKGVDIGSIVSAAWEAMELKKTLKVLESYKDEFSYYIHTSWNVRGTE